MRNYTIKRLNDGKKYGGKCITLRKQKRNVINYNNVCGVIKKRIQSCSEWTLKPFRKYYDGQHQKNFGIFKNKHVLQKCAWEIKSGAIKM